MADQYYYKQDAGVARRHLITGRLTLTSPTSLSNGDADGLIDTAIRRDAVTGKPVLPGTSLAGALRDYLWQRLPEKDSEGWNQQQVNQLFGENQPTTDSQQGYSQQSWLFIDDAYGPEEAGVELRDGVAIERMTRTAEDRKKFDVELLAAGTTFDLRLELWEPVGASVQRQLVALALLALQEGEIMLGGRKRRGFGECAGGGWQVHRYDMADKGDILRWLEGDESKPQSGSTLVEMFGLPDLPSLPTLHTCHLKATFDITNSLLIRAGSEDAEAADMIHLRNHTGQPILSGTSLAGALRARASRILNTLRSSHEAAIFINDLFGQEMSDEGKVKPRASRLWVRETEIKHSVHDRVQSRVKIDRFTGGSYPAALFDQQPVFAGEATLNMSIQKPTEADVGLLLLLLKDLWTEDLPLGGEASVGRGRLRGREATLNWRGDSWTIQANGDSLKIEGYRDALEEAVRAVRAIPIMEATNG